MHEILRTDRPFLAWLRNLGGYPTKLLRFLRLTKAEPSTAPQGRYNAGQRIAYACGNLGQAAFYNAMSTYFVTYVTSCLFVSYSKALAAPAS